MCQYLLRHLAVQKIILISIHVFLLIVSVGIAIAYFINNNIVLLGIISGIMFFATGLLFPMSVGKTLSLFRDIAGSATATMYLINTLMTSFCAFILSLIHLDNVAILFWVYFILLVLCVVFYWGIFSRDKV